jgi:hypothetical protein
MPRGPWRSGPRRPRRSRRPRHRRCRSSRDPPRSPPSRRCGRARAASTSLSSVLGAAVEDHRPRPRVRRPKHRGDAVAERERVGVGERGIGSQDEDTRHRGALGMADKVPLRARLGGEPAKRRCARLARPVDDERERRDQPDDHAFRGCHGQGTRAWTVSPSEGDARQRSLRGPYRSSRTTVEAGGPTHPRTG